MSIKGLMYYAKNHTAKECAEHFSYSVTQIYNIAKNYGIKFYHKINYKNGRPRTETSKDMIQDYLSGKTLRQMADKYNLSREGVRYDLIKSGVYKASKKVCNDKEFRERIKTLDTGKMTLVQMFEYFKDLYPNFQTFRQKVSNIGVPYIHIKRGRKS